MRNEPCDNGHHTEKTAMKYSLILIILMCSGLLLGQNWGIHTNTNHVFDLSETNDGIIFSSWGGVVKLTGNLNGDLAQMQQSKHWTTGDGLSSNDIRSLGEIDFSSSLWFGSSDDGISIISPQGIQTLNTGLGLPSNRVNRIIELDTQVLVATSQGLAVFYYLPGVNFPLMLQRYNTLNTGGGLSDNNIIDMVLAPNNILYLATPTAVNYVPLDSLEINSAWGNLTAFSPVLISSQMFLSVNSENIAIASAGRVYRHSIDPDVSGWTTYSPINGLLNQTISSVHLSPANELLVAYGTWNENLMSYSRNVDTLLTRIDTQGVVTHWGVDEAGLGFNTISRMVYQNGKLYLCSWGDGIYKWDGGSWQNYYPDSIGFPKITASAVDLDYSLWFSSGNIGDQPVRKSTLGVSKYADGKWTTYNVYNSPIHSDNILALAVDSRNRKWFGAWDATYSPSTWMSALTVYDETENSWKRFTRWGISTWDFDNQSWGPWAPGSPRLITNTIGGIYRDQNDNMFVMCYDGGVTVLAPDDTYITEFRVPNTNFQRVLNAYHNGRQYFIGTEYASGLSIWNHNSLPVTGGEHWLPSSAIPPELRSGSIYGVVSVDTPYEGWQHWIASGAGLFMWNETNWYRYDTIIKRFRYNFNTSEWVNDILYYADEERLFASVRTTPYSIYADPFGKIWIGSVDNGLSMYDPARERFTNYYQGNSPLLSNKIISLGYDPVGGRLLIGTPDGLNTLRIGRTVKPIAPMNDLTAYPNPFRPTGANTVQIVNQPSDSMPQGTAKCNIYSASGTLVAKLTENAFSRFAWDGKSLSGKLVSSGIYFFVVTDAAGNSKRGKIAVIN